MKKIGAFMLLAMCPLFLGPASAGAPLAVALPATTASATCGGAAPVPSADVEVIVDPAVMFQTIDGFGTTERLFDDPHVTETFNASTGRAGVVVPQSEQAAIFQALYQDVGLVRVRYNPRDDQGTDVALEPVNDNADPAVTDLTKFDFRWKKNDGHMDLVRSVLPLGVTTFFAAPLTMETWLTEENPEEYVEWAMAILRRWRDAGLEMPYYSLVNEPGYSRSGVWSGEYLRVVTRLLGERLRAEGFETKIVVPDDLNPTQALRRLRVILPDAEARQYVGAIAYHLYGGTASDLVAIKQLGRQYGIPLWMTEFTEPNWFRWANIMHEQLAIYDATAVDFMWGWMGARGGETNSQLVAINFTGNTYTGYTRTKHYYVMRQYARYARPGMRRIEAASADPSLLVTAYRSGSQLSVVLVNGGAHGTSGSRRVRILVKGNCLSSVEGTRTSSVDDAVAVEPDAMFGNGFVATVPAESISSFSIQLPSVRRRGVRR